MSPLIDKAKAGLAGLLLLAVAPLPGDAVRAGTLASPGCMAGGAPAAVAAVEDALDIRLADGRLVRLPGIAVADAVPEAKRDLVAWLVGRTVTVAPLRSEPDRWGRTVALVFAPPPAEPDRPVSVTEALIEAGRVLARPDPALAACWATNLSLEEEAERAGRGLWAATPVLVPGDDAGLRGQTGRFAMVEGRVAAVRDGHARIYLRFADDRGSGMAATLAPTLVRRLGKAGTDPHGWVGRRLRVRGLLDDRWGWQIDVTEPQQLRLDPP